MPKLFTFAALVTALLLGRGGTAAEPSPRIVELETPLASAQPLQAYLRQPDSRVPLPAIVLLHGCKGNFKQLDELWGKRVAGWGYVTLTVDHFGPRGIGDTCASNAPVDMAFDAYRALDYLAQQPFADSSRVVLLGFSQGGWLTLTSLERGVIEETAHHKFRAGIAFYPPCKGFKGNMTVPTLILIGASDDWTPAEECRDMVEGRDGFGISREKGTGVPAKLIVYPSAYHAFDVPTLQIPRTYLGHHLEYNEAAATQAIEAVHDFLAGMTGSKDERGSKLDR
ncbi:MAG TPA: dienelactone hydrolase family protein [Bradyrhizobium sp.]|nr:dienelactone hydrolase family protein [Bradyrhizobium sp.]